MGALNEGMGLPVGMGIGNTLVIILRVIGGVWHGVVPEDSLAFQCALVGMAILTQGLEYIEVKRFDPEQLPCKQVIHFRCGGNFIVART